MYSFLGSLPEAVLLSMFLEGRRSSILVCVLTSLLLAVFFFLLRMARLEDHLRGERNIEEDPDMVEEETPPGVSHPVSDGLPQVKKGEGMVGVLDMLVCERRVEGGPRVSSTALVWRELVQVHQD